MLLIQTLMHTAQTGRLKLPVMERKQLLLEA